MNRQFLAAVASVLLASSSCAQKQHATAASSAAGAMHLEVRPAGSRPSTVGPAANFTGRVLVTPLFEATPHTLAAGLSVSFDAGARSAWHSHPAGQTLVVTAGTGWVQEWGGEKREIKPGDVVWTPPGVKHWHGGTNTHAMTHIAILEHVDGKVVDWMEQVTDQQYGD